MKTGIGSKFACWVSFPQLPRPDRNNALNYLYRSEIEAPPMTVGFWCVDCQRSVRLDLHGNCAYCRNPDLRVIEKWQPFTFLWKLIRMKKSRFILATALVLGIGLTLWTTGRRSETP